MSHCFPFVIINIVGSSLIFNSPFSRPHVRHCSINPLLPASYDFQQIDGISLKLLYFHIDRGLTRRFPGGKSIIRARPALSTAPGAA
jgi:hypothetical protein